MHYQIIVSPEAEDHLRDLTATQRSMVLDRLPEQLLHQPTVETRNRKRMRPNRFAEWELRIRDLRVFYLVREEPKRVVHVRAIGVKVGNRVTIQGEEVNFEET